jgi:hypothetical protein
LDPKKWEQRNHYTEVIKKGRKLREKNDIEQREKYIVEYFNTNTTLYSEEFLFSLVNMYKFCISHANL